MVGMRRDPNLTAVDARAYIVAALFGAVAGLLAPRSGPDRKAVIVTFALVATLGIGAWLLSDDPFAGPSLTVGGLAAVVGAAVRRSRPARPET
jgi:hypothetical protein